MSFRFGRSAIAAILFLGAHVAPGLHAALEDSHEIHQCCTDGEAATHLDACGADHDAPSCPACAAVRAPASVAPELAALDVEQAQVPASSTPIDLPVDPFHVDVPDSRGPPA